VSGEADGECEQGRAGERRAREDACLEGSVSKCEEVDGQDQADETVPERTKAASNEEKTYFGSSALGQNGELYARMFNPPHHRSTSGSRSQSKESAKVSDGVRAEDDDLLRFGRT
jgi:hypothetical protein